MEPMLPSYRSNLFDLNDKSMESGSIRWQSWLQMLNPLTTNVPHHIETSQLICSANHLTGFYMMGNTDR